MPTNSCCKDRTERETKHSLTVMRNPLSAQSANRSELVSCEQNQEEIHRNKSKQADRLSRNTIGSFLHQTDEESKHETLVFDLLWLIYLIELVVDNFFSVSTLSYRVWSSGICNEIIDP